jgi:CheY-like chemotaxis protein
MTAPLRGKGLRAPSVLVVDDAAADRRIVGRLLERAGFDVREADDGVGALRLAAEHAPDAVVMDVRMPGMSGLHVLRRLREDERLATVPVLLVSGEHDNEAVARALSEGADDFMAKPIERWELRARLLALLYDREVAHREREAERSTWLLSIAADGFLRVSPSGELRWGNRAAERLLGLPVEPGADFFAWLRTGYDPVPEDAPETWRATSQLPGTVLLRPAALAPEGTGWLELAQQPGSEGASDRLLWLRPVRGRG